MSESATEPQTESDWINDLTVSDLDSVGEVPISEIVDLDEGEATEPDDSPSDGTEVEALEPAEVDAEDPKEGSEAAEGDDAADEPAVEEPGEVPDPDAEAAETPDAAADTAPKTPDEPEQDWEWKPLTLRADKTELDIPGVLVAEGQGMWIPAASLPKLQTYLADRPKLVSENQTLERRVRELESSTSDAEKAAEEAVKWFGDGFWKLSDDEKWAWLQDSERNQGVIRSQMEATRHKSRADRLEAAENQRREAEYAASESQWRERAFAVETARALKLDAVKDLGIDVEAVRSRLRDAQSRGQSVFFRATKEFVAANPQWGLKEGQLALDYRLLADVVETEARVIRAARAASQSVQAAKQANATKVRDAKPKKAAPAVRAGGTPLPKGREADEPKNVDDWLDSLK